MPDAVAPSHPDAANDPRWIKLKGILFLIVGLLPEVLYIPPPLYEAELPLMMRLANAGLPALLYIPPPESLGVTSLALPAKG